MEKTLEWLNLQIALILDIITNNIFENIVINIFNNEIVLNLSIVIQILNETTITLFYITMLIKCMAQSNIKNTIILTSKYCILSLLNIFIFRIIIVTFNFIINLSQNMTILPNEIIKEHYFEISIQNNLFHNNLLYSILLISFLIAYYNYCKQFGKYCIDIILMIIVFPIYSLKTLLDNEVHLLNYFLELLKIFLCILVNTVFLTIGIFLFLQGFHLKENFHYFISGLIFMQANNKINAVLKESIQLNTTTIIQKNIYTINKSLKKYIN